MTLDKKKQRIASISIGLVLAILLMYIGVRIVQQRASRASVPSSIDAKRSTEVPTDCILSVVGTLDEGYLIRYGSTSPSFYYRFEADEITPQADGSYLQEATISNLSEGQITFIVEGHEDVSTTCDPYTGGGNEDTTGGLNQLNGGQQEVPQPTEVPQEPEPTDIPETDNDLDQGVTFKEPLTLLEAEAYFDSNPGNDVIDCANEFKDDNISYIQPCNEAWRDATAE